MNKLKVRRKTKIRKSLIDFIVYSVFIVLVILAGDLSRDNLFHQNMRTVEDFLLLENETYVLKNKDAFRNIRNDKEYMSNVFIPSVHLGVDTRGRALTVIRSDAAIRTKNREIVLLGVPRIRQLRVSPEAHNCEIDDTFRPHCNQDFYDDSDYSNKDTADYSEGWRKNVVPRIFSERNDFWRFNGAEDSQSTDTVGELNTYDGSGYIAELGRIQSTSLGVLNEIERTEWLDERTRVILVELSLYNPNLNIHSVVILLLEKASSLQYIPSSQVLTWRFPIPEEFNDDLYVSAPVLYFSIFVFSLCLLYFFIFTVVSSIKSFRLIGLSAFRQFLLWVDICIITIGITAIWNHFVNSALLDSKFIELRETAANAYVSFQIEEERQDRQIRFFSILTTLGIVKLWYLLVISSRIFFIIGFTFNITGPFVLGCILILNILLLGFCTGARIVFGEIRNYRSIGIAILTQTYHAGLRNIMPYYKLVEIAPVFGRLFYFGFTVFVVLLFINVMASVITLGMQEAKETSLQRPFRFSYFNYIWLKLQLIIPDSIRKRFESRYNDPLLTQEREDQMERTLIPILWNHIYSIPVRRIQEMKGVVEDLVEDTDLVVVSKKDKEMAKKLKILKIEEGRVNRMRELTIRYIKNKLKIDFEASELAEYNNFNFSVLQLKCKKLDGKMNDLDEIIGKYDLQKLKYLQSNKYRARGSSGAGAGLFGGPWESDSEADATARLK